MPKPLVFAAFRHHPGHFIQHSAQGCLTFVAQDAQTCTDTSFHALCEHPEIIGIVAASLHFAQHGAQRYGHGHDDEKCYM